VGPIKIAKKKEIIFQNDFWIAYATIKNCLFGIQVPSNFIFLVILMAYVINKSQKGNFASPEQRKFHHFGQLHNTLT